MIKLMKYLKKSAGYIVLIIALLFLQAYCDLSLPDYTSKIINVGIQQKGIEDSVPDKLRDSTLQNLQIFMDEDQKKEVSQNYTQEEDTWVLNDDISKETRENLNEDFSKAMMMVAAFSEDSEQGQAMAAQMGLPEGTDPLTALAQMPEEAVQQIMSQVDEKLKDMPESIVTQAGVSFVASEYEALGKDVDAIQMHYILMSGIRMLAMALVIMLAAISVTFISARVAGRLGHDLRNSIYRKVMSFSSREYHKFSTASLITRSTNDVQQVQMTMAMMFRIVLYAPIIGIGGVLRVLETDSSMTWILGVGVVLILVIIGLLFSIAMPRFTKLQTLIDRLNLVTREILTGIPVIRAFSREKHEEDRFEDANKVLTKTNLFDAFHDADHERDFSSDRIQWFLCSGCGKHAGWRYDGVYSVCYADHYGLPDDHCHVHYASESKCCSNANCGNPGNRKQSEGAGSAGSSVRGNKRNSRV